MPKNLCTECGRYLYPRGYASAGPERRMCVKSNGTYPHHEACCLMEHDNGPEDEPRMQPV